MTDPPDRVSASPKGRDWIATVLLPAAVGLVFIAVLVGERGTARLDLQIFAPNAVAPGAPIPIRAVLYDLHGASPVVRPAEVRVELQPVEGDEVSAPAIAQTDLASSAVLGAEGGLTAPTATGQYRLFAIAGDRADPDAPRVSRLVRVQSSPPPLEKIGRLQTELQQWTLFPVRGDAPPDQLDARVVGGDCGAPGPCELLVWVGSPAAAIRLDDTLSADPIGTPECNGQVETIGIVRCRVQGRGHEATTTVTALRAGVEVGQRRVRLPMGPGAPALTGPRVDRLTAPGERVALDVQTLDDRPVVFDVFHEERWVRTESHPAGAVEAGMALSEPGLWRVQARTDPFASTRAATRVYFVGTVRALAERPEQSAWDDPLAAQIRAGRPLRCEGIHCSDTRIAQFLLTAPELELLQTPGASSGAAQWNMGLHDTRTWKRWLAAALIVLAGFFVAAVVVRRGLRAVGQAKEILALADVETGESGERAEERPPYEVWGGGAFVVAAFCVAAALVMSRGCM